MAIDTDETVRQETARAIGRLSDEGDETSIKALMMAVAVAERGSSTVHGGHGVLERSRRKAEQG